MRVLNNYILIKEVKDNVKDTSGLDLSILRKEENRYHLGEVFFVGEYIKNITKGDKIYFDKIKNYQITFEDKPYLVIKSDDIVAVL